MHFSGAIKACFFTDMTSSNAQITLLSMSASAHARLSLVKGWFDQEYLPILLSYCFWIQIAHSIALLLSVTLTYGQGRSHFHSGTNPVALCLELPGLFSLVVCFCLPVTWQLHEKKVEAFVCFIGSKYTRIDGNSMHMWIEHLFFNVFH